VARRPELPEHVDDNDRRKERGELNLDMRNLAKSVQVIGRGRPDEVASSRTGVRGIWAQDLHTGRAVKVVVRDGVLKIEES
jgi:hypothetical protein